MGLKTAPPPCQNVGPKTYVTKKYRNFNYFSILSPKTP